MGFPEFYGKNWNAFWDVITGLVAMPHCLVLWDWDVLRASMPEEALKLLRFLTQAMKESPRTSASVELWDGRLNSIEPTVEMAALASRHRPN